jgi:hypothetical protein
MKRTIALFALAGLAAAATVRVSSDAPAGQPVWIDLTLAESFDPDSVRVQAAGAEPVAKVEWRVPRARIQWRSTGASEYTVSYDTSGQGGWKRLTPPAMVGAGDRVTYGREGVRDKAAVGLWAYPTAFDMDGDGALDLVVGCPDRPFNGIHFFRNLGTNAEPLYDRPLWLGPGGKELNAADFNGDGAIDLVVSGGYYSDVRRNRLREFVRVDLPREYHIGRDDFWQPVDWDGDGRIDLLTGVSDWREYGWDDAYNAKGEWMRGPLRGYVYFHRNIGANDTPRYAPPVRLQAGGRDLDLYGSPAPNPVDWFGTGKLDLIGGSFVDTVTLFRNTGTHREPRLSPGELVQAGGAVLKMDLCMIQPRVVLWHGDGRPSLLIGEEDGTVSLAANTAAAGKAPRLAKPKALMQIDPYVKSGALSRPVAVDWNGDGLLDLIVGNSAGYLQYFENTGTRQSAQFLNRAYLAAGGEVIRRMAGPNGSVQGPAEEKWGYTNPSAGDWDGDGDPDLIVNDIWGAVMLYENTGTATQPRLARGRPLEAEWQGVPPKPEWVWWNPVGKQVVIQWRTTPKMVDWDADGLMDLVMLDHRGYLCLWRRARQGGRLVLSPPERIFVEPNGRWLYLSRGYAGRSGRRKIEVADWNGDGRLDLIVDSDDGAGWYENIGSQQRPVMRWRGNLVNARLPGHNPSPILADFNGDGLLDLLIGAEDGFLYYFARSYIDGLNR